ncbi:hypothetical protein HY642_02515 [Candidatus Woesearchaeota archaeon]|nr:hypothetical protein [Candidatus Woesearchaeota archaeon]
MQKTISVSLETHRSLQELKYEYRSRSGDALLHQLVMEHKKLKLLQAASLFQARLGRRPIQRILSAGERERAAIWKEWFEH